MAAKMLPAGGGDPGKAFLAYKKDLDKKDFKAARKRLTKKFEGPDETGSVSLTNYYCLSLLPVTGAGRGFAREAFPCRTPSPSNQRGSMQIILFHPLVLSFCWW